MTYQKELLAHLAAYRRSALLVNEPGIFRYRGKDLVREHILPVSDEWLNLLESQREVIRAFLQDNGAIKRHRYFHHLNSSQAFAFNLFVPFFEGGAECSRALLRAFGQQGALKNWLPEVVPDADEGTNVDAFWQTADNMTTYCEIKLSEADFGKAKHDARHLKKLREIYEPRLKGVINPKLLKSREFLRGYQILRNVWHIVPSADSRLIFLLPRGNGPLWPMLENVLSQVRRSVRERISVFSIEDILRRLQSDVACPPEMREYAQQLQAKYVPRAT